jgi:hypothetical protein
MWQQEEEYGDAEDNVLTKRRIRRWRTPTTGGSANTDGGAPTKLLTAESAEV